MIRTITKTSDGKIIKSNFEIKDYSKQTITNTTSTEVKRLQALINQIKTCKSITQVRVLLK